MLSKEEIEIEKEQLRCIHLADRNSDNLCNAIKRVEQLESDKQKLIEKLEEDIKANQINYKTNADGFEEYWRGCIDTETEILKILKGEKE